MRIINPYIRFTPDLRMHLTLDEESGAFDDDSAFENRGTNVSGIRGVVGVYQNGKAVQLNSADAYISIAHDPSIDLLGDFTIIQWVFFDGVASAQSIFAKTDGVTAAPFEIHITGAGLLRARVGNGSSDTAYTAVGGPSAGVWSLIVLRMQGDQLTFRINGVADAGGAQTVSQARGEAFKEVRLGVNDNLARDLVGRLDDIFIYDEWLDDATVDAFYTNADSINHYDDLTFWYKMDEATGTTIEDSSQNVNHGTLTNGFTIGVAGDINNAVQFTGGELTADDAQFPTIGTDDFSFIGRFQYNTPGGGGTNGGYESMFNISLTGGMNAEDIMFMIGDGDKLRFYFDGDEEDSNVDATLDDGNWHSFAFVRQGTGGADLLFYIDGVAAGTGDGDYDFPNPNIMEFGNDHFGEDIPAKLDDLRFYHNIVLTPQEVLDFHNLS